MTGTALPIADDIRAAADHGSWCPKMCTFACPVAAATGREEAVPWSFHREVADLAAGWGDLAGGWDRLSHCNGCLRCRSACTYEQDVPRQVLAGRTALVAAGIVPARVRAAVDAILAGNGPDGEALPDLPAPAAEATTAVVVGIAERPATLTALDSLAKRAGVPVRFVRGVGAAAGLLAALGHRDQADDAVRTLAADVAGATTIVTTEVELLGAIRAAATKGVRVVDATTWLLGLLENGSLARTSAPALGSITWHDPDRLARVFGVTAPPRQVLRLLGGVVEEPEGHGKDTVTAGPGLAMSVLAPDAVAATAERRAAQLRATGAPVVTIGGATITALERTGLDVRDLLEVVSDRTQGRTLPTPTPSSEPDDSGDDE